MFILVYVKQSYINLKIVQTYWDCIYVYFYAGVKRDKMVIKSKQRRLMSLTLFEEIAMSYSGR